MAASRFFYGNLGIFAGTGNPTGYHFSSGNSGINFIHQLQRIQSYTEDFTITRTDINQFGQINEVGREIIEQPLATLTFNAYVADLSNEKKIGLYVSGDQSCIKDILNKTSDEHNYFVVVAPEGQELIGWTGQNKVIQTTNATLTSYSTQGAVGDIPTIDVTLEGLNRASSTGSFVQDLKAVDPVAGNVVTGLKYTIPVAVSGTAGSVSALRPNDITIDIDSATLGFSTTNLPIQSYTVSFDLARTPLQKLGSRFAYARVPTFPVTVSASFTANVTDIDESDLSNLLCNDVNYDWTINLKEPACTGSGPIAAQYQIKDLKIDSQSSTLSIGDDAQQFTVNGSVQIGGPSVTTKGLFMSGKV